MDPVVGVTADYATNPQLAAATDTATLNEALLLDAPTTYYDDALKLSLLPSFRLGDAKGYSSDASDYEHFNARAEYDTDRSVLSATAGVSRDSSLYFTYLTNGAYGVRRDAATADVNLDRSMTENLDLNFDANATRVRFGLTEGAPTLVDYNYVNLTPTLSWSVSERGKLTLSAGVGRYASLDGTSESRSGSLQLGFVEQLSEQWTLTASGGYSRALNWIDGYIEEPVSTPFGTIIFLVPGRIETAQNGSVYSVKLAHQGSLLLLTATASRQLQPTGSAFLSRQDLVEASATYTLSPRWTLSADARYVVYGNPNSNGTFSDIKTPIASFTANWLLTEKWTMSLGASTVQESVPLSHFEEHSREVTLTFSRRFNHVNFQ